MVSLFRLHIQFRDTKILNYTKQSRTVMTIMYSHIHQEGSKIRLSGCTYNHELLCSQRSDWRILKSTLSSVHKEHSESRYVPTQTPPINPGLVDTRKLYMYDSRLHRQLVCEWVSVCVCVILSFAKLTLERLGVYHNKDMLLTRQYTIFWVSMLDSLWMGDHTTG